MITTFHEKDVCGAGSPVDKQRPYTAGTMPKNKKGFRLKSGAMCEQDTWENSNPGTSQTINVLHMSENSKWRDPDNAETSLLNSVPRRGFACVFKESTAFGINKFAKDCEEAEAGRSTFEFCFVTWLNMPDCCDEVYEGEQFDYTPEEKELLATYKTMTPGHLKFRKRQIDFLGDGTKFKQDFPLNPREPFLISGANFFNTQLVERRMSRIRFYNVWKLKGLEIAGKQHPDIMAEL
jgi:hypothetical protein